MWKSADKRIQHWRKVDRLFHARPGHRIAYLLLVIPALSEFPRQIEPDGSRLRPGPTHRPAQGKRIDRGEILHELATCETHEIAQYVRAESSGCFQPGLIAVIDKHHQVRE